MVSVSKSLAQCIAVVTTTGFLLPPILPLTIVLPSLAQGQVGSQAADQTLEAGRTQFKLGQFPTALQAFQQALILYRQAGDRRGEVKALRNIGNVFYVTGEISQALDYYQQSLTLARTQQDRQGEASVLQNLGNVAESQGNLQQALDYAQQSLALYQALKDRAGEAAVIGNIGNVYLNQGDYPRALEAYQQSLTLLRVLQDKRTEASTLGNIGLVYYSMGNYPQAIAYHKQHLAVAQAMQNLYEQSSVLNNLGNDYKALGDYGQAIAYLEQSLTISRKIGDRAGEGKALGNLGTLYLDIGNYPQAIQYQTQSLTLARQTGDRLREGQALGNLGNLYAVLGNYAKAIELHLQRLAIAQNLGDRAGEGAAYNNLGNAYQAQGEPTQALTAYQQALNLSRQLGDRAGEETALVNLGTLLNIQKNYPEAIVYQQQALVIARSLKDLPGEALILNNLGNSYFLMGNLAQAEQTLLQALQALESIRSGLGSNDANKISIFEQQARTYRLLLRVLTAEKKTDAALEVAERGRSRAFVELLSQRLSDRNDRSLAVPPIKIAQIQQIARDQQSTLVQYALTYEDIEVAGRVTAREADLLIWVIQPSGQIHFRQVDLRPYAQPNPQPQIGFSVLEEFVTGTRQAIGAGTRGIAFQENAAILAQANAETQNSRRTEESLRQLHQILIQPIADLLPKNPTDRVTFIPQGPLFLAPFSALQDQNGKYLIEHHTVLIAPSIQVLALTRQQRQRFRRANSSEGVLIVGNPTMPRVAFEPGSPAKQLASLPGAEREAQTISALFKTRAIIGNQATERAIVKQMPQARIVHLATHGLLDVLIGQGVPGAIALAPAAGRSTLDVTAPDDGLLTANEILNLQLQAELVVLSACDTGRGRITGDGVIGLSRALISAGAPSVVVSLWQVPDQPTALLMTEFYRQFLRHSDKAQALRQAMLETQKQFPDPRAWAAFILIGEAE
ncbi:hypothetical protein BST81_17445 [Leptolyngbya sp. 'hensonii']|uniref:CHAT domain-containing tetratricopeptide repeat protein n=1 Tax=Leptolyngbya sp. 'hensonii' TaxID=1922337 RepID=UPI00094FDD17|nr:tetratricopeptide repeat protein [Leptolyngbya sp. 'hensonii']OLP17136.1 hypothetical protein BST81_17445 [Leptolyngbya sp. 'hensonii']